MVFVILMLVVVSSGVGFWLWCVRLVSMLVINFIVIVVCVWGMGWGLVWCSIFVVF